MPRHCPGCGDVVEVKTYQVLSGKPVAPVRLNAHEPVPAAHLEDLDVWECGSCDWAEDVEK